MEEDFVLTQPVDIEAMAEVLDAEPGLAQLVLKRQPWHPAEVAAGGVIEQLPDVVERETNGHPWVEHRHGFSLNPCLIPRRVFQRGFTEGSEPANTRRLLAAGFHFGYWGARHDDPRCLHIGAVRADGSTP